MASLRDTLANLVEQYKASDTPLANLMRGDKEGAKQAVANAFEGMTKDPYAGLNVATPVGIAGTFIGPKSKLWNIDTHNLAKALEAKGVTPEEIWKQTGNVKAPDMMWRQEISDAPAKASFGPNERIPFKHVMQHPELFKAYPELKEMNALSLKGPNIEGSFERTFINDKLQPGGEMLYAQSPNEDILKWTMLHENQHAIQGLEDFARGGSEASFPKLSSEDYFKHTGRLNDQFDSRINQLGLKDEFNNLFTSPTPENINRYNEIIKSDPHLSRIEDDLKFFRQAKQYGDNPKQAYRNLLGEVEARMTSNRMNLTPEERLQNFPYKQGELGIDVNPRDIIVRNKLANALKQ